MNKFINIFNDKIDCWSNDVRVCTYHYYRYPPLISADFGNLEFTLHLYVRIYGADWEVFTKDGEHGHGF